MTMETDRDPLRKIPTKHAPEPKADIGKALREAREKRGQTLEAVSQQTRISRRYLEALEKNRFDEFPALAYFRGFLKSYCDYLEVEFEPLWRQAVASGEPAAPPTPASEHSQAPAKPAQPPLGRLARVEAQKSTSHHEEEKSHTAAHESGSRTGAAAAVAALCVLTIGFATWLVRRPAKTTPAQSAPALPAALEPVHKTGEARVGLEFRDDVWVSVRVDGKLLFEGRAPKASRQDWTMSQEIALKIVNPDAVRVTVNGAPLKLPAPDANGVYHIEAP